MAISDPLQHQLLAEMGIIPYWPTSDHPARLGDMSWVYKRLVFEPELLVLYPDLSQDLGQAEFQAVGKIFRGMIKVLECPAHSMTSIAVRNPSTDNAKGLIDDVLSLGPKRILIFGEQLGKLFQQAMQHLPCWSIDDPVTLYNNPDRKRSAYQLLCDCRDASKNS